MKLPERVVRLPEYPFPRLRRLLEGTEAGQNEIDLSVGEPRCRLPDWIGAPIAESLIGLGRYPPNFGSVHLLEAIATWINRRYGVAVDPESQILTLNGSREGLFNASLALCPEQKNGVIPYVLIPNPFYPAYAGGAVAAGAIPYFVHANKDTQYLPDFKSLPTEVLNRTALIFLCSPSNPQGAIAPMDYLTELFELAEQYDFRLLSDECYSEIYRHTPPVGALAAAATVGADSERLVVFNSLSKRSALPGLRSGFAAGGSDAIKAMKTLRSYGGAPISTPLHSVSARAWSDELHVEVVREQFRAKYQIADEVLGGFTGYKSPLAGLFLWIKVGDGEGAALKLWKHCGLRVVPGGYLARNANGNNPGEEYIRLALVADKDELRTGLERLATII